VTRAGSPTVFRALRPELWPALDRAIWEAALQPGDLLDADKFAARWSAASRHCIAQGYGVWLGWLEANGRLDPTAPPEARVTREQVRAYLDALQGKADYTVASLLQHLGSAMQAIAPQLDWRWLQRAAGRIRGHAVLAKDKRPRLRSPEELVRLGIALMDSAAGRARCPADRAVRYRDGLVIALLAYRPIRLKNLAAIHLDRHLLRRGQAWWLQFAATETKTRQALEMPFPADLKPWLEGYLATYRPILAARGAARGLPASKALWLAREGSQLSASIIWLVIKQHTQAAFGVPLCPHLFRDCAATAMAVSAPEQVRMIPDLLGHRSAATADRHYNQAGSLEAGRRQVRTIKAHRRQGEVGKRRR
jgi:integrase/recombinase XerD